MFRPRERAFKQFKCVKIGTREINEFEVEELTTENVKTAMRNLKNNKVAETDGIHMELIKYRGNKLLNRTYELVRQVWEERVPEEWKETIIVPVHKKGDMGVRIAGELVLGIIAYKIFANINLEKIKPYTEKITRDYQNGFRVGRSVTDNIFVLKIIKQKIWEYNQSGQFLIIDFQKEYDSIHRDMYGRI